jgi:RNA polymerase sigma factor, sigma-70 family
MQELPNIEQLFRAHYPSMYRIAIALLRNADEAQDVVSDVFADLLDGRLVLRPTGHVAATDSTSRFLLLCVRNRCLNMLSHRSVKERAARLLLLEAQPSVVPVDVEIAHIDEVFSFMERQLTPQTLQVMRLRFVQQMKYREIAAALNISEVAVYKHLSQGIQKLKQHFNP